MLLFICCCFLSHVSFCVFQKVQLIFLWLFFIFFRLLFFMGGGDFHGDFFCCFFFHSLWRFDEFFLLSLPYMALYGLSSMCYICKTSNIWVDNAQSSGLFLILKAINYFLCFCFVFHSVALEVVVADELELFMWWLIWKN